MAETLFQLKNVSMGYQGRQVLFIEDLTLPAGKIYSILGPNGAGKSTLLRLLDLLEKPLAGNFKVLGTDILTCGESVRLNLRRTMAMVLQNSYMFNDTVFRNIAYGLKIRGLSAAEVKARVEETLNFVGLEGFAGRHARRLSGGETQRVALARAIALRPQVLFLDEPTASLDPENVALVEDLVRKVHQTLQSTIILVTHNLFQAKRLSDEGIFLYKGRLVENQPTQQIFSAPRSELTRQFVSGTMIY